MTVIVIAAFVSGIDARVSKEIESFGTNSIYIYRFDPGFNFNPIAGRADAQTAELRRHDSDRGRMSFGHLCRGVYVAGGFLWWTIHAARQRALSRHRDD